MIAQIELAMLEQLRLGAPDFGFAWKTLATYPVDWEDYLASDALIACPAAWVVFAGWDNAERGDDDIVRVSGSFGVMVADENSRPDQAAQRHGGPDPAIEPGSYRLIECVTAALSGSMLGLDLVSPMECGDLRAVAPTAASQKRRMSRFAIGFSCQFALPLPVEDAAPFESLHANWDIPALGDPVPVDRDLVKPGAQLPDDSHADATDHIQLESSEE